MRAQVNVESKFFALLLEFTEQCKGTWPAGGDLSEREVRASEFRAEGVHADKNFGDFFIRQAVF